ncbi:MAG: glycosyltransferase family 2 protein [Elusimicrobia bacterium]|nr:glycosyltransferase family 2 protein [Candidatus Liberimonas magnetica]
MKKTLVLLTYNEIAGVKTLFDKIPFSSVDDYFVVDGGSTDGTVEYFKDRKVKVVGQEIKGRAEAFRIGIKEAVGEAVVFHSPDGNEDPQDIPKLLDLIENGSDMAIASRFLPGSRNEEDEEFFPLRAWANRCFTLIANLLWNKGKYITDTINGYRAVKKSAFEKIKMDAQGFLVEYQMSIRSMKLGLKVSEIPTIEGNRIGGESKSKSIPTGLLFIKYLIKEYFLGNNY